MIDFFLLFFNLVFTFFGWASSVLSFDFVINPPQELKPYLNMAIILFGLIYLILQIYDFKQRHRNIFIDKRKDDVNKYLLDWLNMGGNTVIFTRNLSWADDSAEIYHKLEEKAISKSLTICLSQNTETTYKLQRAGARIIVHGLGESQLTSRFTVIDYGTNNPRITVGTRNNKGYFVNERFDMNTNRNACNAYLKLCDSVITQANTVTHNCKEDVNRYLFDWLNGGGNTVIFTRNLSWADESSEIYDILEKKARKKSLTICLSQSTQTTDKLQKEGARIIIHGLGESQIKSRFIIVDYKNTYPKITVGTKNNRGEFVNQRFDMQTHPSVCNAFIEIFESVEATQKTLQTR